MMTLKQPYSISMISKSYNMFSMYEVIELYLPQCTNVNFHTLNYFQLTDDQMRGENKTTKLTF